MRKKLTAVVIAVFVFSLIAASAASLNGINTADLGADATVVASCDSDGVTVNYNWTYTPGAPGLFDVTSVDVSGIDGACDGYDIEVDLGDGTSILGTGTVASLTGPAVNVPITPAGTAVDAGLVTEIGIVIENS